MRKFPVMLIFFSLMMVPAIVMSQIATAHVQNHSGEAMGVVTLKESQQGIMATIMLSGLTPGNRWHAMHIHAVDDCSGEGFKTAGGHATLHSEAAPHSHSHGFIEGSTMHLGDMPNIWVHHDGTANAQAFLHQARLEDVLDEDGAAIILHAGQDDYVSQPSGAAGPRIGCGSLRAKDAEKG